MSDDKPTLRELWQLKRDYRNAEGDEQAERDTWQKYQKAEAKVGFVKGLAVYLSD
jgi:hypothetical protein